VANLDAAFGFRYFRDQLKDGATPTTRHFYAGVSALYKGQLVKAAVGLLVPINGTYANDSGANGVCVGICGATVAADATRSHTVNPVVVPVTLAAASEFVIQGDDNYALTSEVVLQTAILGGLKYQITAFATGDALGRSIAELAGSGSHATDGYLIISDVVRSAGYALAPFVKLVVRLNPTLFARGPFALYSA
jgi:hypothetical protein